MRIRNLILMVLVALFCGGALAWKQLPTYCEGSMLPYDYSQEEPFTWPDSLTPRYCAYVARHGARYMTGEKKFRKLEKALHESEARGNLTAEGRGMLAMIDSIRSLSEGRWGELSAVGIAEEQHLGTTMHDDFPPLGSAAMPVTTISSFVPRAMMTMYVFNHAMMLANDSLDVVAASGYANSPLVYFFATDSAYSAYRKDGDWREAVERFERDSLLTGGVERLFRSVRGFSSKELRGLTMEMYSVLQSRRAMGLPAPTDRWMTPAEYRSCWLVSNLTHYLRNNVTPLDSRPVAEAVSQLVETIIDRADMTMAGGGEPPCFDGYFGHAETLLPLLSVLRIPGCYAMPLDWSELSREWQLQRITPLGANFRLILFSAPSGIAYAAVRLNGRNVEPLKGKGRIVEWRELSAYWRHILGSLTLQTVPQNQK